MAEKKTRKKSAKPAAPPPRAALIKQGKELIKAGNATLKFAESIKAPTRTGANPAPKPRAKARSSSKKGK